MFERVISGYAGSIDAHCVKEGAQKAFCYAFVRFLSFSMAIDWNSGKV